MPEDVGRGVPLEITAVNDVVFEKLARDRQASVGVYLGDRLFASYSADAIIVASPTGSTAYSFSAGGPVLSPRVEGIVVTPVAPHMIFNRSLVLAADEIVSVRVLDRSGQVAVSVDGQLRGILDPGDWVAVYAAADRAKLVRLHRSDFYGRLRDRFAPRRRPGRRRGRRERAAALHPSAPPPEDLRQLDLAPPGRREGRRRRRERGSGRGREAVSADDVGLAVDEPVGEHGHAARTGLHPLPEQRRLLEQVPRGAPGRGSARPRRRP